MSRAVHFEIHASDPEQAAAFYRAVLGWTIERWGDQDYWMIKTGPDDEPGLNGGMLPRRGPAPEPGAPVNGFAITHGVADVDATLKTALDNGATIALDKERMEGIGILAYVLDPDGNLFGILQPEPAG
jgi:predicted enzyme related to lactoylglutathione lyase